MEESEVEPRGQSKTKRIVGAGLPESGQSVLAILGPEALDARQKRVVCVRLYVRHSVCCG